jgi:hypothetical protein
MKALSRTTKGGEWTTPSSSWARMASGNQSRNSTSTRMPRKTAGKIIRTTSIS